MAQDTIPQRPPATKTARGFDCVPSPPKVDKSCLLLSYVMKYMPVPRESLTNDSKHVTDFSSGHPSTYVDAS